MPRIRAENIQAHKEQTRSDLLASAAAQFARYGYHDTALADIAADVGVGRTTVYEYFADKEAVLVTLVEETLPPVVDSIVDSISPDLSARAQLEKLVRGHLEFIADDANVAVLIMREAPKLSADAQASIRNSHGRLEQAILAACKKGARVDEFGDISPTQAAELVNTVVMWGARLLLRRDRPKAALNGVVATVLEFLFNGLGATSGASHK